MTKADKEGQRKTPILRFKGFTDAWEQRKLGELMEIGSVKRIHMNEWKTSGVPFFRARDIVAKFINKKISDPIYISNETYNNNVLKNGKVKKGHLLITGVGTIGIPYLITDNAPIYFKDGNVIWLKNNNHNGRFLFYFFTTKYFRNYLFKITGTGTVGTYTIENAKKTPISIPKIKEQIRIGKILNVLNNLIVLYERKYQLYLLQFQKLQRVIFDNSDDFISLSSLIEIKTGNRNSQDNVKNGKYVFFDRSTEIKKLNEFDFDEEAIIIPGEGTKFAPKYVNGKYALHQRSYSLYNFSQEIDSKYLYYFLMTQSNTLLRYSVGTTVPSLRVSTFDHIKVPMYSKELQMKYASTFDSLEKLLSQIKEKTNVLRSLKQFLLQVLFL